MNGKGYLSEGKIPAMADNNTPPISAHQLVDFDWKLKYAVSSSSLGTINKSLLQLVLCISKSPVATNEPDSAPSYQNTGDSPLFLINEYNKVELENLIAEMEAIEKALSEDPGNS